MVGSGHSETTDLEGEEERSQAQGVNINGDILQTGRVKKRDPRLKKEVGWYMYQLLAVGDQGCPWMYLCFSSFYLEDVHHCIVYCKHLDSTPVDLRVTDQVSAVLEGQLFHWLIFV